MFYPCGSTRFSCDLPPKTECLQLEHTRVTGCRYKMTVQYFSSSFTRRYQTVNDKPTPRPKCRRVFTLYAVCVDFNIKIFLKKHLFSFPSIPIHVHVCVFVRKQHRRRRRNPIKEPRTQKGRRGGRDGKRKARLARVGQKAEHAKLVSFVIKKIINVFVRNNW